MKDVLLSESLRLRQKVTALLLFALTILNLTIQEAWGGESNHIQQNATIYVTLQIFGGYEGRGEKREIDSSSLLIDEVKTLRQMINDAQFFDLPETMTSNKQTMLRIATTTNHSRVARATTHGVYQYRANRASFNTVTIT